MENCNALDCERTDITARGLCRTHYTRWRRGTIPYDSATPSKIQRHVGPLNKCYVETCERHGRHDGLCEAHYQRKLSGDLREDVPIVSRTGRYVDSDGYVVIRVPSGTVTAKLTSAGPTSAAFEHQKVMSDHLGRNLLPGETVHHKNGIRDDNRLENLELWSGNHPRGARVYDQIKWAKEILAIYGEDEGIYE